MNIQRKKCSLVVLIFLLLLAFGGMASADVAVGMDITTTAVVPMATPVNYFWWSGSYMAPGGYDVTYYSPGFWSMSYDPYGYYAPYGPYAPVWCMGPVEPVMVVSPCFVWMSNPYYYHNNGVNGVVVWGGAGHGGAVVWNNGWNHGGASWNNGHGQAWNNHGGGAVWNNGQGQAWNNHGGGAAWNNGHGAAWNNHGGGVAWNTNNQHYNANTNNGLLNKGNEPDKTRPNINNQQQRNQQAEPRQNQQPQHNRPAEQPVAPQQQRPMPNQSRDDDGMQTDRTDNAPVYHQDNQAGGGNGGGDRAQFNRPREQAPQGGGDDQKIIFPRR